MRRTKHHQNKKPIYVWSTRNQELLQQAWKGRVSETFPRNVRATTKKRGIRVSEFLCPVCGAILTISVKPDQTKKTLSVENAHALFPSELLELLTFEQKEDTIIVRPKRFLGSDNFAKIAHILRAAKGEYISAGKNSHFLIPKRKG